MHMRANVEQSIAARSLSDSQPIKPGIKPTPPTIMGGQFHETHGTPEFSDPDFKPSIWPPSPLTGVGFGRERVWEVGSRELGTTQSVATWRGSFSMPHPTLGLARPEVEI